MSNALYKVRVNDKNNNFGNGRVYILRNSDNKEFDTQFGLDRNPEALRILARALFSAADYIETEREVHHVDFHG